MNRCLITYIGEHWISVRQEGPVFGQCDVVQKSQGSLFDKRQADRYLTVANHRLPGKFYPQEPGS